MKDFIISVLNHESFDDRPPVLLDIGASGETFPAWKELITFAHCIAFEADDRELSALESTKGDWKQFTSFRSLATSESLDKLDFHLTKSPFCSSTLKPDNKSLADWEFASLFDVEKTVSLETTNINKSLLDAGISYVDWFKTDSQGTDLRLFTSLPDRIRSKMLVADFEPGIIDAYLGEDKLHHILSHMDKEPFWVHSMDVKGAKRIIKDDLVGEEDARDKIIKKQKDSPCWCEISYLNDMKSDQLGLRESLLGWVFSTILQQHGFALGIARKWSSSSNDEIFGELIDYSLSKLS
ncbi:MAG: hypothetical protein HOI70_03880 [Opitutae bacterium]|jgi:hypothetical protein|nr:hypothetical protein [Opitutae bacterium]